MRTFNATGVCIPEKHYMVNISDRIKQITSLNKYADYPTRVH